MQAAGAQAGENVDRARTPSVEGSVMGGLIALLYAGLCYLIFFAVFVYSIGFVGNLVVPKSIDSGPAAPLEQALIIDLLLLGLFAVQHSAMARPAFKRRWTQLVPKPVERSTYVLFSSLVLALLFWQWRPMTAQMWSVEDPGGRYALWAFFWAGWLIVLLSTFLINHFDLFGLRQAYLHMKERAYTPIGFQTPFLYKLVRHPLMLGFIVAFWATPEMSAGHLLFAAATTAYILLALQLEERDLVSYHGTDYEAYRQRVPMVLPLPKGK
jgi:protein-S-isoprenylcysteine O-methyltransferase Ste14